MTQDSILEEVLNINSSSILLEMGTGTGKTKLAIEKTVALKCDKILVVAPMRTILQGWAAEFNKWGYASILPKVTLTCYKSLDKYLGVNWDMIIFDEAHHLSEAKCDILLMMSTKNVLFLSATMKRDIIWRIKNMFPNLYRYKIGIRESIDEGILPDPKIILIPLQLNSIHKNFSLEINPKAAKVCQMVLPLDTKTYWNLKRTGNKNMKYTLTGSTYEYYKVISSLIDLYKRKSINSTPMKNKWLKLSGDRLKWLARLKNNIIPQILMRLTNERTLTFCCDIEQSNALGPNSINSKEKEADKILEDFNNGKINHIQACAMLDEGVNLVNCRVGIFANINSSERIVTQRNGRILRHKSPIIVLPYFMGTREEEIVEDMLANYNPALIQKINNINELKV